ncbi:hypothetical protein AN237_26090 (plasmid) [Raoultella ornithinolytica]|nr:hypothetical protein AN237_26090 [Raoultella ornithinolytica]
MMREHVLMRILAQRTQKGLATGSDGFTSTATLSFDVGLNTRALRRVLDEAVRVGAAERRENGPGKPYSYRMRVKG